jgi:hypothetical protein
MYSIKNNGDNLAYEFLKLVGKTQPIEKIASEVEAAPKKKIVKKATYSDADLSSLLVDDSAPKGEGQHSEALDSAIDSFDEAIDYAEDSAADLEAVASKRGPISSKKLPEDPAGHYIMNGLGKISASLRAKGEGFAADVVEATAFSIRGDFVKEAKRKLHITSTLNKIASDFARNGDNFAADMVSVTVNKISN